MVFLGLTSQKKFTNPLKALTLFCLKSPAYSKVMADKNNNAGPYDINIDFPKNNAKIHLTYKGLLTEKNNQDCQLLEILPLPN